MENRKNGLASIHIAVLLFGLAGLFCEVGGSAGSDYRTGESHILLFVFVVSAEDKKGMSATPFGQGFPVDDYGGDCIGCTLDHFYAVDTDVYGCRWDADILNVSVICYVFGAGSLSGKAAAFQCGFCFYYAVRGFVYCTGIPAGKYHDAGRSLGDDRQLVLCGIIVNEPDVHGEIYKQPYGIL